MINTVHYREWQLGISAIDRARACVDHMPDLAPAGELQYVQVSNQICLHVRMRILDRISHPRLRAEMDDCIEIAGSDAGADSRGIGEIDLFELELVTPATQFGEAIFL